MVTELNHLCDKMKNEEKDSYRGKFGNFLSKPDENKVS